MRNGYRQSLMGRLKSGLIAPTLGLAVVAAAVMPAVAQEPEPPEATATAQGIAGEPAAESVSAARSQADYSDGGIKWRPVLSQSLLFLTVQHLARFSEDRTTNRLGGPFVNDWFDSVRSMNRFDDGGHISDELDRPSDDGIGQREHPRAERPGVSGEQGRSRRTATGGRRASSSCLPPPIRSNSRSGRCRNPPSGTCTRPRSTCAHVYPGNLMVGGRGPGGAARPSAAACESPEVGQRPDDFHQPDEEFANLLAFKAPWACEAASCH